MWGLISSKVPIITVLHIYLSITSVTNIKGERRNAIVVDYFECSHLSISINSTYLDRSLVGPNIQGFGANTTSQKGKQRDGVLVA